MTLDLSPLGIVGTRLGVATPSRTSFPDWLLEGAENAGIARSAVYLAWELVERIEGGGPLEREALLTLAVATTPIAGGDAIGLPLSELPERFEMLGARPELAVTAMGILDEGKLGTEILGGPEDGRPLAIRNGRLCPDRLLYWERELTAAVGLRRAAPKLSDYTALLDALDDVLSRPEVRDGTRLRLSAEEQHVVRTAATRPITFIDAAPRPERTTLLVALLRVLARLGPSQDLAIVAPSGRAARFLRSAIHERLRAIPEPGGADVALRRRLPEPESATRLASPGTGAGVVVVSDATSIGLEAMGRLARSLRPDARLVLFSGEVWSPLVTAGAALRRSLARSESAVQLVSRPEGETREPGARNLRKVGRHVANGNAEAVFDPDSRAEESIAVRRRADAVTFVGVELLEGDRDRLLERWYRERIATPEFRDLIRRPFRSTREEGDVEIASRLIAHLGRHVVLTLAERDSDAVHRALRSHFAAGDGRGHPIVLLDEDEPRGLAGDEVGVLLDRQVVVDARDGLLALDAGALGGRLALGYARGPDRAPVEQAHALLWIPETARALLTRSRLLAALEATSKSLTIVGSKESVIAAVGRD